MLASESTISERQEKHGAFQSALNRLDRVIDEAHELLCRVQQGNSEAPETIGSQASTTSLSVFLDEGTDIVNKMAERLRNINEGMRIALF